jgi:tetratricopeptide (TPR) repeat protein
VMRIRIKNKYLIVLALLAAVSFGAVSLFGGDYLFYKAKQAEGAGKNAEAFAYYEALIQRFPRHSRVPDALYWSAELLPSFDTFIATFFPQRSSVTRIDGGMPELPEGSLTRIERYLRIREEYPRHWAAAHVDYRLADACHALGDPRSEELYLEVLQNERSTGKLEAALRLVQMYAAQSRFDEALSIIDYCERELPNHSPIEVKMKLGDVLNQKGDYPGASQAYAEVLALAEAAELELHSEQPILPYYQSQVEEKLASLERYAAGGVFHVEGRVTLYGEPMAGVQVYTNPLQEGSRSYYGRNEPGLWVTGADGSFSGTLPAGKYEFGIGLNYHLAKLAEGSHLQIVHGELDLSSLEELPPVEFRFVEPVTLLMPETDFVYRGEPFEIEWEPYPGAYEYSVLVSGVTADSRGGSYHVHTEVGTTRQTGFTYDGGAVTPFGLIGIDADGVHPAYLVGRPEAYDKLLVAVRAFDQEGNLLASTGGLHFGGEAPITGEVAVGEGLRSRAEGLLLERKYEEGVNLLEKQLEEDPSDLDTLWSLARIYFSGTHAQGGDPWDSRNFAHRDLEKSLAMLERIRQLKPGPEVEEAMEVVLTALNRGW